MLSASRVPPCAAAALDEIIAAGTASQMIDRFAVDTVALAATDSLIQAHPVDPPHATVLGSIERIAEQVAPALGWQPQTGETA